LHSGSPGSRPDGAWRFGVVIKSENADLEPCRTVHKRKVIPDHLAERLWNGGDAAGQLLEAFTFFEVADSGSRE
jgi:hypothetical protein